MKTEGGPAYPSKVTDSVRVIAETFGHRYPDRLPVVRVEVLNADTLVADGVHVFQRVK